MTMGGKIKVWDHDTISDDIEYVFALYGHEHINARTDVLADIIDYEFGYKPPHSVLNLLARTADDF